MLISVTLLASLSDLLDIFLVHLGHMYQEREDAHDYQQPLARLPEAQNVGFEGELREIYCTDREIAAFTYVESKTPNLIPSIIGIWCEKAYCSPEHNDEVFEENWNIRISVTFSSRCALAQDISVPQERYDPQLWHSHEFNGSEVSCG